MTREEVIRELQELARNLGKGTLTQQDIQASSLSRYWVDKYFPTLASALEAAGLEPSRLAKSMSTSDDELLDYLVGLQRKLGKRPTHTDIRREGKFSEAIFRNRFGSLGDALRQLKDREVDRQLSAGKDEKGTAAEYLVVAELLYRGFNANSLPVDRGIDIVALKDSKTFSIQVKNVSIDEKDKLGKVAITVSAYRRHRASDVYYIFVLNRKQDRRFLVLPYHKVEELISNDIIQAKHSAAKKYLFDVLWHEDQIYINEKIGKADVTSHLDAWEKVV